MMLLRVGLDGGVVDPGDGGQLGWCGSATTEPAGVGGVGGVEGHYSSGADFGGGAVMDRRRGVQTDPGVTVVMVVIVEERLAEHPGIGDRSEAGREGRAVLE